MDEEDQRGADELSKIYKLKFMIECYIKLSIIIFLKKNAAKRYSIYVEI